MDLVGTIPVFQHWAGGGVSLKWWVLHVLVLLLLFVSQNEQNHYWADKWSDGLSLTFVPLFFYGTPQAQRGSIDLTKL